MKAHSLFVPSPHAVVTGGSRGIGLAIAQALRSCGARVSIFAKDAERLAQAKHHLEQQGSGSVFAESVDIGNPESLTAAFQRCSESVGPIQILVNNAGAGESCPFDRSELSHWQKMIEVNLTGTFLCTHAVIRSMLTAGTGRVVNIASTAGLTGYKYVAAYCAAKHGVVGLTRALAVEYAHKGITFNAVCPGYTRTDLLERSVHAASQKTGRSTAEIEADLKRDMPAGRFVEPHEVAEVVAWLCSAQGSQTNGAAIVIDGTKVQGME